MTTVRDSDIRDALIFLTQLAAVHENGRPKGRAYLDLIRQQFPKEEFEKVNGEWVGAVLRVRGPESGVRGQPVDQCGAISVNSSFKMTAPPRRRF